MPPVQESFPGPGAQELWSIVNQSSERMDTPGKKVLLNTLPEDLLARVLAEACLENTRYYIAPVLPAKAYALMGVCRRFRDVIQGCRTFWADRWVELTGSSLPHPRVFQWLTSLNLYSTSPYLRGSHSILFWAGLRDLNVSPAPLSRYYSSQSVYAVLAVVALLLIDPDSHGSLFIRWTEICVCMQFVSGIEGHLDLRALTKLQTVDGHCTNDDSLDIRLPTGLRSFSWQHWTPSDGTWSDLAGCHDLEDLAVAIRDKPPVQLGPLKELALRCDEDGMTREGFEWAMALASQTERNIFHFTKLDFVITSLAPCREVEYMSVSTAWDISSLTGLSVKDMDVDMLPVRPAPAAIIVLDLPQGLLHGRLEFKVGSMPDCHMIIDSSRCQTGGDLLIRACHKLSLEFQEPYRLRHSYFEVSKDMIILTYEIV